MRILLLSSVAGVAMLAGTSALAQSATEPQTVTQLPEVTVTATRTEQNVEDVPATVSVITDEEIEENLVTDIRDLVRFEPGVSVPTQPARFGAALGGTGRDGNSGFNIRGLEGNRVLIQTDGVRVPDAYSFGPSLYGRGDFVDLDMLQSVEILRGPASALYGSDGVAGAVTFVTRDPEDFLSAGRNFGFRARAAYGSADESTAAGLIVAGRAGQWSGLLSYTRRDASETETGGSNDVIGSLRTTANPQDLESNAILGKIVFEPNDNHRFRLTYDHFDRDVASDILSGRSATVLNLLGSDTTDRDRVSLDWFFEGIGAIEDGRVTAYWQDSDVRQFTFEDRTPAVDRTRDNTFDNRVWGGSAEASTTAAFGGVSHRFTYGADYSMTRQEGIRTGTVPPQGETFPIRSFPNTDYSLAGVFLQDEISLMGGNLTLFPALRFDWYDLSPEADALYPYVTAGSSDSQLSPKIGAMWWLSDNWGVFANAAMGFKAPAPSQVNNGFSNLAFGYVSLPNPDLQPETSQTIEGGVRLRRWDDGNGGLWSAGVTAFYGEYDDFIIQDVVSGGFTPANPAVYQFINVDAVTISGVEFRANGVWENGFGVDLALAWQRGQQERRNVEFDLPTINPFKIVTGVSYRDPGGRFGGQIIATHAADLDADGMGLTCAQACFGGGNTNILDLTGYWNVTDQAVVRVGVFNVTDEQYWNWSDVRGLSETSATLDAYSQPGRNFAVSLTYRY